MKTLLAMCGGCLIFQAAASDTPAFRLTQRDIPERGQVGALQLAVGQQQVSLILPKNWRVGQAAEGVVLQAADYSATLIVKSVKSSESLNQELKNRLAEASPAVVIGKEYGWTTGAGEATVIEACLGDANELPLQSRTYIIKLKEQSLVLTLSAAATQFAKAELLISSVIASLRVE
ncbi:MAG: hypothetical protein N3J91_08245 [Verrucomicrobiae bacterium]|nr:hypothetical protein [Verrucomicrobiae bacterium]